MNRYDVYDQENRLIATYEHFERPQGPATIFGPDSVYRIVETPIPDHEIALRECRQKRAAEYPTLGDFADAFVKMQAGDPAPLNAYVSACQAVKAKYPKPTDEV